MHNYGTNRMLRIATILEWLEYSDTPDRDDGDGNPLGLTIAYFAKTLKVPLETIRNDIFECFNKYFCLFILYYLSKTDF